jgi:UDP-N-acetyl-D-mannosaminuronate dehydrogenase
MNIDIMDVIEAAAARWNFNVYYPGAGVGGHCLPVDPYYLVTKAEELGYYSKVITAGRAVNDYMPLHVLELLCPGADFSARFTYEIQDEAGGFAQVLGLTEGFVDEEDVVVILGDNIFQDSIREDVRLFIESSRIFLKEVPDANWFGVDEVLVVGNAN